MNSIPDLHYLFSCCCFFSKPNARTKEQTGQMYACEKENETLLAHMCAKELI